MSVEFVPGSEEDLPAIRSMMGENDWGFDLHEHGRWHLARDGDELVGTIHVTDLDGARYFDDVLVTEARRGAGLGAAFVRHLLEDAPDRDCYLCCHDPRIAFYERLGFERVDEGELRVDVRDHAYRVKDLPSRPDHVHHLMRRRA